MNIIAQQTKVISQETRPIGKTKLTSQMNNDTLFDTGKAIIIEEIEETKTTQKGLFGDLFGIMSSKNQEKEEKSVNTYKLKNREIEFRDNSTQGNTVDEKLLNIPAYLRKKK